MIFSEIRDFFFFKKNFSIFFEIFLTNLTKNEKKLTIKKRKILYYEQNFLKKGYMTFKKKVYLELLSRALFIFFCFWNDIQKDPLEYLKITIFYPRKNVCFENFINSMCERTTIDFHLIAVFFYKFNEEFIFGILKTFKRLIYKKKKDKLKFYRILIFKILCLFFDEFCKMVQFKFYLSKKSFFRASLFSKILRISSGNFSTFGFFFWKLKPRIFLMNFVNFFFWKLSIKQISKNFLLVQETSEFLKTYIFGPMSGYSLFLKIFCFNIIIENFFLYFLGLSISTGKTLFSGLSVLKSSKTYFQKVLQWNFRDKETSWSNLFLNERFVVCKDFLEIFFREIEKQNNCYLTLKNIPLKKNKKFKQRKNHCGGDLGLKKQAYSDIITSCLDYETERTPVSETDVKLSGLVLSQFSYDLFRYFKKTIKNSKKKYHSQSRKIILSFLFFHKDFFLI